MPFDFGLPDYTNLAQGGAYQNQFQPWLYNQERGVANAISATNPLSNSSPTASAPTTTTAAIPTMTTTTSTGGNPSLLQTITGSAGLAGGLLYTALGNGGGNEAIDRQREVVRSIKDRLTKTIQERFSAASPEATALKTSISARAGAAKESAEKDIARRGLTGLGVDVSKNIDIAATAQEGSGMAQLSADWNQRKQQLVAMMYQQLGISEQNLAKMLAEREAGEAAAQGALAGGLAQIGSLLLLGG